MTPYQKLQAEGGVRGKRQTPEQRKRMARARATAQSRAHTVLVARHRDEYDSVYRTELAAILAELES